jgi:hypothetical protein
MTKEQRATRLRVWQLANKFQLKPADYIGLLRHQQGRCAICGHEGLDKRGRRLAVDHCHATGKVRGLLCSRCNTALGMIGDTLDAAMKFVRYINRRRRGQSKN